MPGIYMYVYIYIYIRKIIIDEYIRNRSAAAIYEVYIRYEMSFMLLIPGRINLR